ncbi:MAG: NUDIX domain-containing protein [Candidatus Microgenomates bacterium]|jgi:8-oxo-dGTP pyrophosphatase MutT (NUDIX family)
MGKNPRQKTLRQFSSGGAVYKKEQDKILWLVTQSAPSDVFPNPIWRFPKGWIDNASHEIPGPMASGRVKADEESLQKAALREVSEEGGVAAKIINKIGTSVYFLNLPEGKVMKFVTFYLMQWQADLPEGYDEETSEVKWLEFNEARKLLSFSHEKQILDKAFQLLV